MPGTSAVGLDLGSSAIKIVRLERDKNNSPLHLVAAAMVPTPAGGLTSEVASDQELVAIAVRKLLNDMHIVDNEAFVALSESFVFTRVIELPLLSEAELESAIKWQAEQYIPLPLSEVTLDFVILTKPKDSKAKMQVLLVAAPLRVIERTLKMLELSQLTPLALETEIIASVRTFGIHQPRDGVTMIVDSGAITTDLSIVANGSLLFTHSTSLAGEAITRTIATGFNFERSQAEEYKRVYGLDEQHFQGKVRATIKPIVDTIVEEIRKSLAFYQEKNPNLPVKTIVLSGGTSLLPGLVGYLASVLGVEVQLGNPWNGILIDSTSVITVPPHDAPIFGVATGLALRPFLSESP